MPAMARNNIFPFFRPRVRLQLFIESFYILAIYTIFVLLALYVHAGFWLIFSGLTVGHCVLAFYLAPEHNGLPHEGNILEKTRTMQVNNFVKILMWNMPYHAEHHAYPAVPFHALPALHEALKGELKHDKDSYPGFHLKVLSGRKLD